MKYYVIAGEASGDLHGANLLRHIFVLDPQAVVRCWGGDKMQARGGEIVKHYRDLAFMGFTEVIANLRTILRNIEYCKTDIVRFQPDVVILIDYPGFNLRIAEFAHRQHYKVVYYISPQVWAWKKSRVYKIKQFVDKMLVILPFEKEFYANYNYSVTYVGHPLLDAIDDFMSSGNNTALISKPYIALLPGSRKQEITVMLPLMLQAAKKLKGYDVIIAGAPSLSKEFYNNITGDDTTKVIFDATYHVMQHAHAALVTSGTATLETALFGVPQVVCYKGGWLSVQIAKRLIKIRFISLVNLIADKEVVKELIQHELTCTNILSELTKILDGPSREKMLLDYNALKLKLGNTGASERAAKAIVSYIHPRIVE